MPRNYGPGTWITTDMIDAYERLHTEGWAHSIEIWRQDRLVGGLYGIVIGTALFGESMYSEESNASKFALVFLDALLDDGRLGLIDGQIQSAHLSAIGAQTLPRDEFTARLDQLCEPATPFKNWPANPIQVPDLLSK